MTQRYQVTIEIVSTNQKEAESMVAEMLEIADEATDKEFTENRDARVVFTSIQ